MEFMSNLYKDISSGDASKNETKMEVDFFVAASDDDSDDVDGGGTRGKRNTKELADTAITFIAESKCVSIIV